MKTLKGKVSCGVKEAAADRLLHPDLWRRRGPAELGWFFGNLLRDQMAFQQLPSMSVRWVITSDITDFEAV